jgi:hypothetical protein
VSALAKTQAALTSVQIDGLIEAKEWEGSITYKLINEWMSLKQREAR